MLIEIWMMIEVMMMTNNDNASVNSTCAQPPPPPPRADRRALDFAPRRHAPVNGFSIGIKLLTLKLIEHCKVICYE